MFSNLSRQVLLIPLATLNALHSPLPALLLHQIKAKSLISSQNTSSILIQEYNRLAAHPIATLIVFYSPLLALPTIVDCFSWIGNFENYYTVEKTLLNPEQVKRKYKSSRENSIA